MQQNHFSADFWYVYHWLHTYNTGSHYLFGLYLFGNHKLIFLPVFHNLYPTLLGPTLLLRQPLYKEVK